MLLFLVFTLSLTPASIPHTAQGTVGCQQEGMDTSGKYE